MDSVQSKVVNIVSILDRTPYSDLHLDLIN